MNLLIEVAMASFGELISEKRRELGWSQRELAERVLKEDGKPISPQYLNDLERDRRGAPSDQLIETFATVLQLDKDLLFYSAGEVAPDLRGLGPAQVKEAIVAFRQNLEKSDGK